MIKENSAIVTEMELADYDFWVRMMKREYKTSTYWNMIGEWGWPTRDNDSHKIGTFTHLCHKKWERSKSHQWTAKSYSVNDYKCGYCGEMVPEGMRMIAFLEKL